MTTQTTQMDPEIAAISAVYEALKGLDGGAQTRVLEYVTRKLAIELPPFDFDEGRQDKRQERATIEEPDGGGEDEVLDEHDDFAGISPVAKRWMKRNGLNAEQLSSLYSLGVDEIDLVARSVPGATMKDRMRSVMLLKGIAGYLSSGAARITHEQLKEAAVHYDAYDAPNFARNLKAVASEVSGTKEEGYSLTTRGMASATEMIKGMQK